MKFPATSDELKAANYEYDGEGVCRGCKSLSNGGLLRAARRCR